MCRSHECAPNLGSARPQRLGHGLGGAPGGECVPGKLRICAQVGMLLAEQGPTGMVQKVCCVFLNWSKYSPFLNDYGTGVAKMRIAGSSHMSLAVCHAVSLQMAGCMHHARCISPSSCGQGRGDPAFAEGKILHFLCFLLDSNVDQWFSNQVWRNLRVLLFLFKESTLTFSGFTF